MMIRRKNVWGVLAILLGVGIFLGFIPSANANDIKAPFAYYQIDGGPLVYLQLTQQGTKAGNYEFGLPVASDANGTTEGGMVTSMSGLLNPDPSIVYGIAVVDFGAPSVFGFVFGTPIVPIGAPNTVTASLSYSLTDATDNGISLTPPVASFVQVSEVGFPLTNMGVNADALGFSAAGGANPPGPTSYNGIPAINLGPLAGPGPGPWTWMQVTTTFTLSGGGDAAAMTGGASITQNPVPEPTTLLLLGLGLIGLAGVRRRMRM